jgi:hypothetical protein
MKKLCLWIMAISLLSGCAESSSLIRADSGGIRTDIFEESPADGKAPQGYTDLRISASFKTHKPGSYSACNIHGTPEYRLLVNIDGQATFLSGSLKEEKIEPRGLRDPEAGEGMRYTFSKMIRLISGAHRIMVVVPEDNIMVARDITLDEERRNHLVLEPIYGLCTEKQLPGFHGVTNFNEGLKGFSVILNGKPIKDS